MSDNNMHVEHLTDDYVHELLPDADAARVESHCASCPACARALEKARRRLALLRALPPAEPSSGLVRATLDRVADPPARRRLLGKRFWVGALAGLAACAAVLLAAQLWITSLKPSTLDLVVLGQRELLSATTASLRVRLTAHSGQLLYANVPVVVALRGRDGREQVLVEARTDDQGSCAPRFTLPDWPDDTYTLEVRARGETVQQQVKLKRDWKLMLSSDKPVYQPGQTILLRALGLRRPDLKPVAGKNAVFTLTDPRGNVLFKHVQPTSKYGIASAECPLAQEIQEGAYTVACAVEGTVSRLTVEVKRYVLPKFKVSVRTDRPYYVPGREKAVVTFQADYFFGKPVAKGELAYEITSLAGQRVASEDRVVLDDKGAYRLEFPVPDGLAGRENDSGDARLLIAATVTDSAGQKHGGTGEMLVTTRPVRVEAIPESGQLVLGVANTVYLLVRRADGAPVPGARVGIVGGELDTEVKADACGAGSFQLMPNATEIPLTFTVRDASGEWLARSEQQLRVGALVGDFLVRLDRAVCKAGQSLTVSAFGGGTEPVFLDLIKDGQTMLSQMIAMNEGKGELTLDVPPDLFGTVQLVAYRFVRPHGLPVRKARVLYITPPESLRIQATMDRPEYRPGREATITFRLSDDKGRPTPGAISLAAVDEAVFSVLAQRPGMEQAFYNLEQELLKPVYAIYPWQPEDDGQNAQRDQALFAATGRVIDTVPPNAYRQVKTPQIPTAGPHTLGVRSLPAAEQRFVQQRDRALSLVRMGWAGVGAAVWMFVLLALATLPTGRMMQVVGLFVFALVTLVGVAWTLLPTLKMAVTSDRAVAAFAGSAPAPLAAAEGIDRPQAFRNLMGEDGRSARPANQAPRVRREFPETLLWKPELITDDDGRLPPLKVPLADSITTWRLSASAVAADGRLGAGQWPMKVFQPFFVDLNLPVSLTRGDEVGVPVVVYNYLNSPQTVTLTMAESPWFALEGANTRQVELAAGEVRSLRFTIKAARVGTHPLKVTATAGAVGDAIERQVEVVPDGRRVEFAHSGDLANAGAHTLTVPPDAVAGSVQAFVKVYPSSFSTLLEGLENIFRMPYGCFEQTSSTTYPNVLALDYLRRHKLNLPQVEAKARQYIHLGYQRLVGFEVQGGGFDWYGRAPANVTLTAYGLMEFTDMARVHDVDPRLLERTRSWLLKQRQADGSWAPDIRGGHLAGVRDQQLAQLARTAYIAWALFAGQQVSTLDARVTLNWMFTHLPSDIQDPHTLALVCNAVAAVDPNANLEQLQRCLDRLAQMAKNSDDGRLVHWEKKAGQRTIFYGAGVSGQVETTALAALALLQTKRYPELARGAVAWLMANKDANGTWHSTQATVLALKAILQATGQPQGDDQERRVVVQVGGHTEEVVIPADQSEVLRLVDVSRHLSAGDNHVRLSEKTKTGANYQVVFRYHVPEEKQPAKEEPLAITIAYDRTELSVGGTVEVKARVTNRQAVAAPMVMLDLPVPPGFAAVAEDFAAMVQRGAVARYQVLPRSVLVYLRGLESGAKLELAYRLRATMPVRVASPGGRVYEYYDPQKQGRSAATRFVVRPEE